MEQDVDIRMHQWAECCTDLSEWGLVFKQVIACMPVVNGLCCGVCIIELTIDSGSGNNYKIPTETKNGAGSI